jgi:hypothetical protein
MGIQHIVLDGGGIKQEHLYFGGRLYYDSNNVLTYNPGRQFDSYRDTCARNLCREGNCDGYCEPHHQLWVRITNTKTYLTAGIGLNSWSGRMEIIGFESHDNGLAVAALESGFWIDQMLAVCRTGTAVALPANARITEIRGTGFVRYDTGQEHIITNSTFRKCGYRNGYNQYDTANDRGCGDETTTGCSPSSSTFGFLTHSDEFNPGMI